MTRVCNSCERLIQSEVNLRLPTPPAVPGGPATRPVIPRPRGHNQWEEYPRASCTCRWNQKRHPNNNPVFTHCFGHQVQLDNYVRVKKSANDNWLRTIAWTGTRLAPAASILQTNRVKQGTYRACPCGKSVTPEAKLPQQVGGNGYEAYVCMVCCGYVSVVDPRGPSTRWQTLPGARGRHRRGLIPAPLWKRHGEGKRQRLHRMQREFDTQEPWSKT